MSTSESAELSAARKRIQELETELEITRRAEVVAQIVSDGLPIEVTCRIVGVSVSGFYMWKATHVLTSHCPQRDSRLIF
jgi:hypothetical protein